MHPFHISRLGGPKDTLALPSPTQIFHQVNPNSSNVVDSIFRVSADICSNLAVYVSLLISLFFNNHIPNVCLSEGFVAGVGPKGAYTADLSLDQSKVRINQFRNLMMKNSIFCLLPTKTK